MPRRCCYDPRFTKRDLDRDERFGDLAEGPSVRDQLERDRSPAMLSCHRHGELAAYLRARRRLEGGRTTDGRVICVVDGHGTVLERHEGEHSAAGLRDLVGRLRASRVSAVAIERPDGPGRRRIARCGPASSPAATPRPCAAAMAQPATRTTGTDAYILATWQDGVPYDPERHQALGRVTLARAA